MTESGISPHTYDMLPSDCEPHGPSFYLTLPCRSLSQAVTDISRVRDLETWVWDLLRDTRPTARVIDMAAARAERRRGVLVRHAGRGV